MIQKLIEKFNNWFDEDKKKIFLFVIIFGFMANILVITADILFADTIVFTDYWRSGSWDLSLGRWALKYVGLLRYGLASSVVSTLLSLLYLSVITLLLLDLFDIKNKVFKFIFAGIVTCSPFFMETLFSTFCSAEFLTACLLSTLAVYLVYKCKNGFIGVISGGICLAVSLGLYQAYLAVATSLCILLPMVLILKSKKSFKEIIKKLLLSMCMGLFGGIVYLAVLKILLNVFNVSMASYSGANELGFDTIKMLPSLIIDGYKSFYNFFFTDIIINNLIYDRNVLNGICFGIIGISIVTYIIDIIKSKTYDWRKMLLLIICILLTPLGFCIIELIVPNRDINVLMSSAFSLLYLLLFCVLEFKNNSVFITILKASGIIVTSFIFITYLVMSNATYMNVRINKEKTVTGISMILDKIYTNPNYNNDTKIMFAGNGNDNFFKGSSNEFFKLSTGHTVESPFVWGTSISNCNTGWQKFIRHYIGQEINVVEYETQLKILEKTEFKKMPIYPSAGSIKMIDGVMVVKLDENSTTNA